VLPALPPLIDSHCHLEIADFGDERDEVLARARAAGLAAMVCVGSGATIAQIENAVALADAHPDIWAAVGIHPHDVARTPAGALELVERLATSHPRVVAVGETGLDYHYNHSPRDAQQAALRDYIAIARRARKPLSLHIRDAHDDAIAIAKAEHAADVGGVVHCFTGTPDEAARWVDLGFHVSFSGILTFKSAAAIRQAAAQVPADRILVETDCPYLAPVPLRGKRNEPAYVVHTARAVAVERGLTFDELAAQTTANARRLFKLDKPSIER
jgi:TatD DNase family protein